MNYNILAYGIYSCITIYVIYWVGKMFYKNGSVFILRLFHHNEATAGTTNNILLIAYYLFNIGYAIMQFSFWEQVGDMEKLIASISEKCGILISILAVTHYFNMALIYFLSKKINHHPITIKN